VILIAMGAARLGSVIKYIPYPLTVGFTAGIALLIAVSQVRDQLGQEIGRRRLRSIWEAGIPPARRSGSARSRCWFSGRD
jgi:MFS superfamily sulfate permease-like transporter